MRTGRLWPGTGADRGETDAPDRNTRSGEGKSLGITPWFDVPLGLGRMSRVGIVELERPGPNPGRIENLRGA